MLDDIVPSFEALTALAKEDPIGFETLRKQLCQQILDQAPEHTARRLKGLQFKINMERRRSKTALKSCIELSKLMNNSLTELEQALSNPQSFLRDHCSLNGQLNGKRQQSAEIIQLFPTPKVTLETNFIAKPSPIED